jgi:hypothetical protein
MRTSRVLGLFFIVLGAFGCAKNSSVASEANKEDPAKTRNDAVQKLYDRKDEFAAMKAPAKSEKASIMVAPAFIMFRLPGLDWEVVGMEKDAAGKMTLCFSDKCNNRNIMPVKNRIPKLVDDARVNYVVRADCKEGKKLGDLNVSGDLFESDCAMTVIRLGDNSTVATGRVVTPMPKTPYAGAGLDLALYATKGDKSYLVPIAAIDEYLNGLSK